MVNNLRSFSLRTSSSLLPHSSLRSSPLPTSQSSTSSLTSLGPRSSLLSVHPLVSLWRSLQHPSLIVANVYETLRTMDCGSGSSLYPGVSKSQDFHEYTLIKLCPNHLHSSQTWKTRRDSPDVTQAWGLHSLFTTSNIEVDISNKHIN